MAQLTKIMQADWETLMNMELEHAYTLNSKSFVKDKFPKTEGRLRWWHSTYPQPTHP